ncbi:MAG: hypothetical protein WD120_04510 [Gemmatimonadota bacterium]
MREAREGMGILTLEPLVDSVREGMEHTGWTLSGLQKTTSMEFEGRWKGESTRSAYLFFHRPDLPEAVTVEGFLDETARGLRGNLALVVDGPELGAVGDVPALLTRVARAAGETLPEGYRLPLSLRVAMPDACGRVVEGEIQIRFKLRFPSTAFEAVSSAIAALGSAAAGAFERLLERPEVAELLPPVVD